MSLTDTQEGVLNAVFRIADKEGFVLDTLEDLRVLLNRVGQKAKDYQTEYGNITTSSVGAIQRNLLLLEDQGGDKFFGYPEFDVKDLIGLEKVNDIKKGIVNILAADKLYNNPRLYSAFLMWLLTSIYNTMPEVGDLDKPKFIFFFDEAHLLFDDASKSLLEQIEKIVRLIRSKGVGVYFITQNPMDIPEDVLVKRLSGRRTCADCGKSYHIVYNPPKKEGVCDVCGGELTQRSDESEEAVQVRIDTYNKQTKPLIDYYTMLGELTNVDGNQSMDEVAKEIYKVLDNLK